MGECYFADDIELSPASDVIEEEKKENPRRQGGNGDKENRI